MRVRVLVEYRDNHGVHPVGSQTEFDPFAAERLIEVGIVESLGEDAGDPVLPDASEEPREEVKVASRKRKPTHPEET